MIASLAASLLAALAAGGGVRQVDALDRTFCAGAGTRAVFDLGNGTAAYSGLVLHVDRDAYFTRVAVDVADRPPRWRTVRAGTLVYRAGAATPEAVVRFAGPGARYVRVRVLDGRAEFPLDAVSPLAAGAKAPAASPERAEPFPPWFVGAAFAGMTLGLGSWALRLLRGEKLRHGGGSAEEPCKGG